MKDLISGGGPLLDSPMGSGVVTMRMGPGGGGGAQISITKRIIPSSDDELSRRTRLGDRDPDGVLLTVTVILMS